MSQEILDVLQRVDFFNEFNITELAKFSKLFLQQDKAAGEYIVHEGKIGDALYIILKGKAEVLKKNEKTHRNHCLKILKEYDYFGEFAFFGKKIRIASVRAKTKLTLLRLDAATLKLYCIKHQEGHLLTEAILRKALEHLDTSNELSVQVLERELEHQVHQNNMGRFLTGIILVLCLFSWIIKDSQLLLSWAPSNTVVSLIFLLAMLIYQLLIIKQVGYPWSFYGFTLHHWRRSMIESLIFTVPILVITLVIKWFFIHYTQKYQHIPLFNPYGVVRYHGAIGLNVFEFWLLMVIIYIFHSFLQEFLVRGMLQGMFLIFLNLKRKVFAAIIYSNILFSTFHIFVLSAELAGITFVVGLFWGWLYARHKTLVGVILSHILIGIWALFIIGFRAASK